MKTSKMILIATALGILVFAIACGGGGGGGGGTTPPPAALIIVPPLSVPDGMIGEPYSLQFSSRGGTGGIRWSLPVGSPTWAFIDSSGKLTGTASIPGLYGFSIHAQDSATTAQGADYYVEVFISSPMQMTVTPSDGIRGYSYWWDGQVTGGKPPFTVSVASGSVPNGISASASGNSLTLSGTAADLGTFQFTLRIRDSASTQQTLDQPVTLKILSILKITSERLRSGIVGRAYSDSVPYVNGTSPFTWTIESGDAAFSIDANGKVTGTPSASGDRNLLIKVKDSSSPQQSDSRWMYMNVSDVLRVVNPVTTYTGYVGEYAWVPLEYSGGVLPVSLNIASGNIPSGFTFNGGVLAGTPTQTGTWTLGVHYADSASPPQTYDQPVVVTVLPPKLAINSYPPTPLVGEPYGFQMMAVKGTPPYKWEISNGVLPAGLSLSQGGAMNGTPAVGGRYFVTFRVTDSGSIAQSAELATSFTILPKPLGRNDSVGTATPMSYFTQATLSPYEDPPGTAAPDTDYYKLYALSGSEVAVSVSTYQNSIDPVLEIVDENGFRHTTCKDPADDNPAAPIVHDSTPTAFDDECLNDDISLGVITNSQLTFKVPGDAGKLTTFYAHVLDLQGNARPDMGYSMTVNGATEALRILSDGNVPMVKGSYYQWQIDYSGGNTPINWAVVSGTLPSGITLSSSGLLSGTPTTVGNWVFEARARDSSNPPMTATKTFGVTVTNPLTITSSSLPSGQTGVGYSAQLAWTGGTAPFSIFGGALPPGLKIDGRTGAISGTPTSAGTYSANFTIIDPNAGYAYKFLDISVSTGPLYIGATGSLPNATKSAIYSAFIVGSGGKQPYSWQLMSGALPPGMALNTSTGEVRGIPTSTGVFSFTVKVTDANAASATATLQLTVQ
jgi:hypothetical protein